MDDLLEQFINAMIAADCGPANVADIIADDKKHYFTIQGDKLTQKKGAYCLKIDGDFAVGFFINYRVGEVHSWHSRSPKKLTNEEREAYKKKIAEEKRLKEIYRTGLAKQAAINADVIWKSAKREGSHPYIIRKGLSGLHGARISGDDLIVAAFKDGRVSTLQTINADGDKRFMQDGEKQGSYFPIANAGEDLSRIVLCEGFATGATIREATGLPVVIAFDAGNLIAVAKTLKNKYINADIIIAADNDAFTLKPKFRPSDINPKELDGNSELWESWREQGFLSNTGIEKAQVAAIEIGGARVVIPRFKNVTDKPTDWNDLFALEGLDAVKQAFDKNEAKIVKADTDNLPDWHTDIPLPEDEEAQAQVQLYVKQEKRAEIANWKEKLVYKPDGSLVATSNQNLQLFLEHDKVLSNLFCYDSFACEMKVYQCPPWENNDKFKPRVLTDDDVTFLSGHIEKFGLKISMQNVGRSLFAVVKKNARNPAQEYFNNLKWDGVKRLDTWLIDYCGADTEAAEYVSTVGRKWLCASVMRVFEPGYKFDNMLVLEGNQGIGKSTIFKELATIHGTPYFDDKIRIEDLNSERVVPRMQGLLIIEIAELAGIRKYDADSLKNSLSVTTDRCTLKYQNQTTIYERKFVFAGTINPGNNGYLNDSTGNRRFWPVSTKNIDVEGFKKVKEQIWAEAVSVARNEKLYLYGELDKLQQEVVSLRLNEHPWTSEIARYCESKFTVDKDELWDLLCITDRTKRTSQSAFEIGKIMTSLGFKNKRVRVGDDREYRWVRE